jgi:adenylate cyclase
MPAKILFVDDESDQAKLMQRKFRRNIRNGEFTFLFASDGQDALEILGKEPDIDVVVSDINMPRMDGLTLLDRLSDQDSLLKAVIVSAYGDMANIRSAMNKGAFDFITKPVDFDDLEATIQKTLREIDEARKLRGQLVESERIRANLSRFFSPNLAYQLVNEPERLEVGGERRELSFLFTDLADFTTLVEGSEPSVIVSLLNEYLDEMTNIVFDHGGTVDKVVGDAIHAMFGAPMTQQDHAARAVACAMDLDEFAQSFSARRNAAGVPLGHTRIGVNTGTAIVGNFGGETLFDYTAHGDAVNTAARLEAINKLLGTRICVSADTVSQVPAFRGRPVGSLLLKGKTRPVDVFEPLTPAAGDDGFLAAYRDAYERMDAGDSGATQAFATLAQSRPDDRVIAMHLRRLQAGETGTRLASAPGI